MKKLIFIVGIFLFGSWTSINAQGVSEFNEAIDRWMEGDATGAALVFVRMDYSVGKETINEDIYLYEEDNFINISKTTKDTHIIIFFTPKFAQWGEIIRQLEKSCDPLATNSSNQEISKEKRMLVYFCGNRYYQYMPPSDKDDRYIFTIAPKKDLARTISYPPYSESGLFYYARAIHKVNGKDYITSMSDFNKAIEMNPTEGLFYYMRGTLEFLTEDYQKAVNDFTNAINYNHITEKTFYSRGTAKLILKDYRGAIEDMNKVIDLNPNRGDAYNNRGMATIWLGDINKGCLDLSKAVELGYEDAYELIKKICN